MIIRDQKPVERSTAGLGNIRAKLMLVLLCLLWGINWPVMKIALQEIPPLSMRTISSAFAALTLLGACVVSRRRLRIASAKSWGHVCVISLLNIGFFSILSAYAQITAATTRVTILAYTMPIWAVLLAWAVLRERPNASQTLAVVLCALGLAVLIYPLAKGGVPLGLLLALAAGAVWGAGTVYIKWAQLELDPLGALAACNRVRRDCGLSYRGRWPAEPRPCARERDIGGCVRRYLWQWSCLRNVAADPATTACGDCVARRARYSSSWSRLYRSDYRRKAKRRRHYRLRTDLCGFGKCAVRTIDACAG